MNSETFEAVVTDVRLESTIAGRSLWRLALNHTCFAPGDRGELEAEARSGARLVLPVVRVETDAGGTLWHVVEKPLMEGTKLVARRTRAEPSLLH